ncbi:MAG: hypothetical protein H6P99_1580 [Holophagaceae bacterium]|nr:hypothetical protein [Holophagaceae bacterium]
MFRSITVLTLSCCGLALAAAPVGRKAPASAQAIHKGKVPVTVTARFGEGKATVSLRFEQAVADATLGFRGLDGLAVSSVPPIGKTRFEKGETLELEVLLSPGPGRSHLAVDISGSFRGQVRMGVFTFAVGKPTPEQEKAGAGTVLTTTGGQRLKIMPARKP